MVMSLHNGRGNGEIGLLRHSCDRVALRSASVWEVRMVGVAILLEDFVVRGRRRGRSYAI